MTSPGAHLPWPPPGLEPLRGRALVIARRLGFADLFILGALAGFSLNSQPVAAQGSALVCLALALIGSLMLLSAARAVWTAVREGGTNVWRGYTWLTIAEVMVDRAGDTGALIGGADAFAELSAETRSNLRMARVVSGLARLGAGIVPLPVFFLLSAVGANESSGMALSLTIAVVPSLILLAFASVAGSTEFTALRAYRDAQRKRFDRRADAIKIADEWYGSFEMAREGQAIGRGIAGGVLRAWAVGGVLAVGIVGVTLTFVPVWLLAAAGSAGAFAASPGFANSIDRIDRIAYMRAYTPPIDSTITPERAGAAFRALSADRNTASYLKPSAVKIEDFPPHGDTLFRDRERRFTEWRGPQSPGVLDIAKKGLTPAQHDYLAALSANKVWESFGTVARARRADIAGGMFVLPLPATLSPYELAIPRFTKFRELAYASTARAAFHLANGHVADAENDIRETVAVGFRIMDDGNTPSDPLMGAIIVGIGHDALLRLYTLTNNSNLTNFRSYDDAARARRVNGFDNAHLLGSQGTPRGIRIELIQNRAMQSCGNIRALLFGPSTREQRELKSLRSQIARTPAEEALFDLSADATNRPAYLSGAGLGAFPSMVLFSARISGALLRSQRIPTCASALGTARPFSGPR